jgi:hypothetical protein
MPARHVDADGCLRAGLSFRLQLQGDEGWQICLLSVAVKRQPFTHEIGVDAVAHRNAGHRCAWLQAFLDDLNFEGLDWPPPIVTTSSGYLFCVFDCKKNRDQKCEITTTSEGLSISVLSLVITIFGNTET